MADDDKEAAIKTALDLLAECVKFHSLPAVLRGAAEMALKRIRAIDEVSGESELHQIADETYYIVRLEDCCWLADGDGDPPRTIVMGNAKKYLTWEAATYALAGARHYRPFTQARVFVWS